MKIRGLPDGISKNNHKKSNGVALKASRVVCKTAMQFKCKISFQCKNTVANAKSVLSVLGACIKQGDEIELICEGDDESQALAEMLRIIEDGLGE